MIAALLLVLGLSGLGDAVGDQLRTQAQRDLSAANFRFTFDLYKQLVKPGENLISSGISVSTVLSMLLSGSQGRTYSELATALKYDNLTRGDLHGAYPGILRALKGNGSYDLSVANSMWTKKSFHVEESFRKVVRDSYDGDFKDLNIPTAKEDINSWVSDKTKGMIPQLLDADLSEDTVMVLLNAIFFKGKWAEPFDNKTFEGGFLNNDVYIADYPSGTTELMSTTGDFLYTQSQELKAYLLDLPYEGDDVSMTILLPFWTLEALEVNITAARLQRALDQMRSIRVDVVMPVFEIESSLDLNGPIKNLGANEIFGGNADFSNISPQNLKVSKVIQKAKIQVSVEGTKASGASGLPFETLSLHNTEFRATRPFLFLLRHKPTNTIMFAGRYTDAAPYRK